MEQRQFRSHPLYGILAFLTLLLSALFAWDMRDGITGGELLFLLIGIVATLVFVDALTTVIVIRDNVLYIRGLRTLLRGWATRQNDSLVRETESIARQGTHLALPQLTHVEQSGRLMKTLTLLYHPVQSNGLIDTERLEQITLPMVQNQDQLQEWLEAAVTE